MLFGIIIVRGEKQNISMLLRKAVLFPLFSSHSRIPAQP